VQHVGTGGHGDIGPVVHGEQRVVAGAGLGDDLQGGQFLPGLQGFGGLVAQLDDVHAAGQRGVHELGQVAAVPAGVRAQVQPRVRQPCSDVRLRHVGQAIVAGVVRTGVRMSRAERGLVRPRPSNLIRIMPAQGAC